MFAILKHPPAFVQPQGVRDGYSMIQPAPPQAGRSIAFAARA